MNMEKSRALFDRKTSVVLYCEIQLWPDLVVICDAVSSTLGLPCHHIIFSPANAGKGLIMLRIDSDKLFSQAKK
ncbi:MAG: hypothetical protein ACWGOX_02210, partial [Desulforhopalus sp.]